jgi:MrfA Zn-binding domain
MTVIAEIQRSQLITTYGIGSIYDALDYSVIIAGQDDWLPKNMEVIYEERLQRKLEVEYFKQPKVIEDFPTIPSYRFPEWVFCPMCKTLKPIYKLPNRKDKKCARCKVKYVPVRFVVACPNGHLDDFPWNWWVHRGKSCDKPKLKINTTGRTTSLAGIEITCDNPDCKMSRSLERIFDRNALKGFRCWGRRPWLGPGNKEECTETPRVLQRGATSVYYSQTESAISIPPYSERIYSFINGLQFSVDDIPDSALPGLFTGVLERTGAGFSVESLVQAVVRKREQEEKESGHTDLRQAEYEVLCNPGGMDARDEFVAQIEDIPSVYREKISKLVLVHRLREVRALTGFTRIIPDTEPVAPISRKKQNWYPAAEMKGEGIFIELNAIEISAWLNDCGKQFLKRVRKLEKKRVELKRNNSAWTIENKITPQFLLIHTLAHILVQQLILECGYSSSSLRERLYYNDGENGLPKMNGFLIYTATSDSEGSLGGLVRQGEKDRFLGIMGRALESARWCSNDPLCIESEGQGSNSLNMAACHSCCLLPETSCELRNCYLDRAVVIGLGNGDGAGYFPENI